MNQHAEFAIKALITLKGDDLARAKARFATYTSQQMGQPYRQGEKTPAQIIAAYQAHEDKCNAAIAWVRQHGEAA